MSAGVGERNHHLLHQASPVGAVRTMAPQLNNVRLTVEFIEVSKVVEVEV